MEAKIYLVYLLSLMWCDFYLVSSVLQWQNIFLLKLLNLFFFKFTFLKSFLISYERRGILEVVEADNKKPTRGKQKQNLMDALTA